MGLLRSTALTQTNDGYALACRGMTVNGILLGEPILLDTVPITVAWDHVLLPNGIIAADGTITADND